MAGQDEFKLDTKHFSEIAEKCKSLYESLQESRNSLENVKNDLLFTWAGKGRNEFEKQYRLLNQQFSDIIDDTKDMYEKIIAAEESYIQADTDAAKQRDGIERRV